MYGCFSKTKRIFDAYLKYTDLETYCFQNKPYPINFIEIKMFEFLLVSFAFGFY